MDQQRQLFSHLLRRAGFGANPAELDTYVALGYEGAVNRLLNYEQTPDSYPDYQPTDLNQNGRPKLGELQLWWLNRMLITGRPLQEKMTLFWHGHFATADSKVNNPVWMFNQNELFRSNALGSFQTLLSGVSKDPAMMKWLDNQTNRTGSPNENYAREVMELFTMGLGSYTEQDVKEGARALTGWVVPKDSDAGQFVPRRFDSGVKNYLGHSGNLGLEDVVSILAGSPHTAKFLARKLARFFISDTPDDATVGTIADTYASTNGDMKAAMRTVLTTDAFRNAGNFMDKITSPAEFVVTNLKLLGAKSIDKMVLPAMAGMGQELFNPPNVAGWPGNRSWLNTDTIFTRLNFAGRIVSNRNTDGPTYVDPASLLTNTGDAVGTFASLLTDDLLAAPNRQVLQDYFSGATRAADAKLRGLVHLILSTPTAHLN